MEEDTVDCLWEVDAEADVFVPIAQKSNNTSIRESAYVSPPSASAALELPAECFIKLSKEEV